MSRYTGKWHRIWAMVIRHLRQLPSDFNKLSSIIYWPFLDIVIIGFMGEHFDQAAHTQENIILLSTLVAWQIVVRADFGISLNLLEEIWAQNITNLFSTPLSITEWICAAIVEGFMMLFAIASFCAFIVYVIYGYNIFTLGFWSVPIFFLMFIAGLAIGFFTSSLLIYWGVRVQSLAWMIGWIFAPVSGCYYPITVLPDWLQSVAHALPLYYATETIRVLHGNSLHNPSKLLLIGYLLGLFYLSCSIFLFICMFKKSKDRGLQRLRD
jgi:ABC-2 type transport system permease protein